MRTIRYILGVFLAIVVAVMIMKYTGVTWKEIDYFIFHGFGNALNLLDGFHDAVGTSPLGAVDVIRPV